MSGKKRKDESTPVGNCNDSCCIQPKAAQSRYCKTLCVCLCQVLKCKVVIRECVKFCEEAEGDKAIPSEHYDSSGELPEKFIFCAKCLKGESEEVGGSR